MAKETERVVERCITVLRAALTGGEDEIRTALERLDPKQLNRLRNSMLAIADLAQETRSGWSV
jgi:predicted component of type VI protein secretion system